MTGQLDVIREGNLGIIALNRPEAINALSLEMIDGITRALEQWADDDEIRLVLFEGRGPRGFCSGGDVRAVRKSVLDGEAEVADAFFAAEYRMNGIIARSPPVSTPLGCRSCRRRPSVSGPSTPCACPGAPTKPPSGSTCWSATTWRSERDWAPSRGKSGVSG